MLTLTAEDVAARAFVPLRTAQRWFERWQGRGWPSVRREKVAGDVRWRLRVDAAEFAAWASGAEPPAKQSAA
jgi:hypothetical protein